MAKTLSPVMESTWRGRRCSQLCFKPFVPTIAAVSSLCKLIRIVRIDCTHDSMNTTNEHSVKLRTGIAIGPSCSPAPFGLQTSRTRRSTPKAPVGQVHAPGAWWSLVFAWRVAGSPAGANVLGEAIVPTGPTGLRSR